MGVTTRDFWSEARWERIAPLSGVIAVALVVIGFLIHEGGAERPGTDEPASEFVSYFEEDKGAIFGGNYVAALGLLFFLWFLGSLRARLVAGEGGVARLASLAFGAGVGTTVLLLAGLMAEISGTFAFEEGEGTLDPGTAQALAVIGDGFAFGSFLTTAVLLGATGILAMRTLVLPRWLGWITLVLGLAILVPWIGWFVFIILFPLWILLLSVWMWLRPAMAGPVP